MLLTNLVLAFIDGPILPGLFTGSFLQVVHPLTFVLGAICVIVGAKSVGFIILPLTVEDISINVVENTLAVSFVVKPLTFVAGSIWPGLHAETMAEPAFPLTIVNCSVFKRVLAFFY